jgi:hypothetical protein
MFFSVRLQRSQGIEVFCGVRSCRGIDIGELLSAAVMLVWQSVRLVHGVDNKIDLFYSIILH